MDLVSTLSARVRRKCIFRESLTFCRSQKLWDYESRGPYSLLATACYQDKPDSLVNSSTLKVVWESVKHLGWHGMNDSPIVPFCPITMITNDDICANARWMNEHIDTILMREIFFKS